MRGLGDGNRLSAVGCCGWRGLALPRGPWTVQRSYRRERHPVWLESICGEFEPQVRIGAEDYYLTSDGLLMPTRKDQPSRDLRNFK
jgi:hypothetical protein